MDNRRTASFWACFCILGLMLLYAGCGNSSLGPDSFFKHSVGDFVIDLPGGIKMAFMRIPAGTFTMGAPETEQWSVDNERPQHEVTFTRPFYIGKYEVTQAQWYSLMEGEPENDKEDYPVIGKSWYGIVSFIGKLNEHLAGVHKVRVPVEAEWEYACRAGTTTTWWFGESSMTFKEQLKYMVFSSDSLEAVGTKPPNPWGLYDMNGNAAEVCGLYGIRNEIAISPYQSPQDRARFSSTTYPSTPQVDPEFEAPPGKIWINTPGPGSFWWVAPVPWRGGNCTAQANATRSAARYFTSTLGDFWNFIEDGYCSMGPTGFRLVLDGR